jgi:hypothetical protein
MVTVEKSEPTYRCEVCSQSWCCHDLAEKCELGHKHAKCCKCGNPIVDRHDVGWMCVECGGRNRRVKK